MTITIQDLTSHEVNGITRYFMVVNNVEYMIPKKYYRLLEVGKTYEPTPWGYKLDGTKWNYPLDNYIK